MSSLFLFNFSFNPVNHNFMLRLHAEQSDTANGKAALEMTLNTLRMMAKGGIHDHVGLVGFHTYIH